MKKTLLISLVTVAMLLFAVSLVLAGVTEIKLYTNENPIRYWDGYDPVGPNHAANYLGQKKANPHVNGLLIRIGMNADVDNSVTPPDSNNLWITSDAAMGPYAIHFHFVTMPNPRTWWDIWRSDTPGYTEYLDASSTERITFWIKGEEGCQYPLWLRVRSQNHPVDGKDVEGAYVCIDGETIVRTDPFGYHFAASDVPFNGEWQFVSIPWTFFKLGADQLAELQEVIPYSWAGLRGGEHHVGGPDFDLSTLRTIAWDTREGGNPDQGNYPWPEGGASVGSSEYLIDEVVLTLNEGSGVTDVDGNVNTIPLNYDLGNNYPNPFNPTTSISYSVPVSNNVTIEIFNELGQKVRTLVNRYVTPGTYHVVWDGTNDKGAAVPSGIYFYKMTSSHFTKVKKMILSK